jgi:hypothetical protein
VLIFNHQPWGASEMDALNFAHFNPPLNAIYQEWAEQEPIVRQWMREYCLITMRSQGSVHGNKQRPQFLHWAMTIQHARWILQELKVSNTLDGVKALYLLPSQEDAMRVRSIVSTVRALESFEDLYWGYCNSFFSELPDMPCPSTELIDKLCDAGDTFMLNPSNRGAWTFSVRFCVK